MTTTCGSYKQTLHIEAWTKWSALCRRHFLSFCLWFCLEFYWILCLSVQLTFDKSALVLDNGLVLNMLCGISWINDNAVQWHIKISMWILQTNRSILNRHFLLKFLQMFLIFTLNNVLGLFNQKHICCCSGKARPSQCKHEFGRVFPGYSDGSSQYGWSILLMPIFIRYTKWSNFAVPETKWTPYPRRHFKMHFLEWKCVNFD